VTDSLPALVVVGGPLDGQAVRLDRKPAERVLGSGPECTPRFDLANVAPAHALFVWDARGVLLSDSGSPNGTYVNGEKIGADHPLADGDRIFLGPPGSKQSAKLVAHVAAESGASQDAPLLLDAEPEPLILSTEAEGQAAEPLRPPATAIIIDDAPAPPSAPKPTASPAPRAAARPEYDDAPSIAVSDRPREPAAFPAAAPASPAPKPAKSAAASKPRFSVPRLAGLPRPVIVAAATLGLALLAYFGARLFHRPPPVLTSTMPPKAEAGQTVTVVGTGFASGAAQNVVHFGALTGTVTSASDTQLAVTVPDVKVPAGVVEVQVSVESHGKKSNALFLKVYAAPKISGLDPDVAMPGDEVTATGQNLAGQPLVVSVDKQPAEVLDAKPTALRFRVPELRATQGRSVPVVVQVGPEAGRPAPLLVGRLPLVIEAKPPRGRAGERIVLRGRGFDPKAAGNSVAFGNEPALVLAATAAELTVTAPPVVLPQVTISVRALGRASSSDCVFMPERPGMGTYTPRYFPAPVPEHPDHDHVFVSTELGPALLLTGKADAASTAERAEHVAKALNLLVEAAEAGRAASLEVREQPLASVAVVGSTAPLVTVSAADTAGYDEAWDASAKRRRATPQSLATYWAALLQDSITLFVRHQRPSRVLELSLRGKAFVDLYAEASRTAGAGAGVPSGLLSPPSASVVRAFREMALLLPAEGQARAGAAIEGRWEGTMEETGVGEKGIEVRFHSEAGRLSGSVTTRAGGVAMDVPMREASYDKASVRFVLVLRGTPKHFVGTVSGESLSGSIFGSPEARDAVGRFSLKYVE
jgi:hypothetical protein